MRIATTRPHCHHPCTSSPSQSPTSSPGIMTAIGSVASDIGTGITEMPQAVLKGVRDAVQESMTFATSRPATGSSPMRRISSSWGDQRPTSCPSRRSSPRSSRQRPIAKRPMVPQTSRARRHPWWRGSSCNTGRRPCAGSAQTPWCAKPSIATASGRGIRERPLRPRPFCLGDSVEHFGELPHHHPGRRTASSAAKGGWFGR